MLRFVVLRVAYDPLSIEGPYKDAPQYNRYYFSDAKSITKRYFTSFFSRRS
jgi:hypothetical protein